MIIRNAYMKDLKAIAKVECECFPECEAADIETFKDRLTYYPNHFWLLEDNERLVAFVNGMVTNKEDLSDEMYANAALHDENGKWQMIFGVNTIPSYRRQGLAGRVIKKVISDARVQGRKGLVLTCKEPLLHYYAKFGFVDEGISNSKHGGVVWHKMRLTFDNKEGKI